MGEKCVILRKLRDFRDLIFDAKFNGVWLYRPCEVLVFQWMRLVSAKIQSCNYDATDFLIDLNNFSVDVRYVDGIEKERVEVFDTLVADAIKKIRIELPHDDLVNFTKNKEYFDDDITADGRHLGNTKSCKAVHPLSSNNNIAIDVPQKLVVGITDLFQKAVDCTINSTRGEYEVLPSAGCEIMADTAAERVSTIFRSLYEHGSQHGSELLAQYNKRKLAEMKKGLHGYSVTSSQHLMRQQDSKEIQTSKITPSALLSASLPKLEISNSSNEGKRSNALSKVSISSQSPKKKHKSNNTVTNRAETPILDWLKVDITRTSDVAQSPVIVQATVTSIDHQETLNSTDSDTGLGSSSSDSNCGWVAVGTSSFRGVYPLTNSERSTTVPSTSDTCPENEIIYSAKIELQGRLVELGLFPSEEVAAKAHDRALIRAIGPSNCRICNLNYPISAYSHDQSSQFMEFDEKLKTQLTATSWNGLKPCDFGFLLVRGSGQRSILRTQTQKMAPFLAGFSSVIADCPVDMSRSKRNLKVVTDTLEANENDVTSSSSSNSGKDLSKCLPPSKSPLLSSSLKSRIVRDGEIERIMVPPPSFGTVISVANAHSTSALPNQPSSAGGRGRGRGRGRGSGGNGGSIPDKLPIQRVVYLGLGKHITPGRYLLGFQGGSRLVSGVTFVKSFPQKIFTSIIACVLPVEISDSDKELLEIYKDIIQEDLRYRTDLLSSTTLNDTEQVALAASDEQNHLDREENDMSIMPVDPCDADSDTFNMPRAITTEIITNAPCIGSYDGTKVSPLYSSDLLPSCTDEGIELIIDTKTDKCTDLNRFKESGTVQGPQSIALSLKSDLSTSTATFSSTSFSASPSKILAASDQLLDCASSSSIRTSSSTRISASSESGSEFAFYELTNPNALGDRSEGIVQSSSHRLLSGYEISSSANTNDLCTKSLNASKKSPCFPTLRNLIYPSVDTVPRDPRSTSLFPLDPGLGSATYVHDIMNIPLDCNDTHTGLTSMIFSTSSSCVGLVGGLKSPVRFGAAEGEKSNLLVAASSPSATATTAEIKRNRGVSPLPGDAAHQFQQVSSEMACSLSQEFLDEENKIRLSNLTATDIQKEYQSVSPKGEKMNIEITDQQSSGEPHGVLAKGFHQQISEIVFPSIQEMSVPSGMASIEFKSTHTINPDIGLIESEVEVARSNVDEACGQSLEVMEIELENTLPVVKELKNASSMKLSKSKFRMMEIGNCKRELMKEREEEGVEKEGRSRPMDGGALFIPVAVPLLQLSAYKSNAQAETSPSLEIYANGRSRRSTSSNMTNNLEVFNSNTEKYRVNEILPWVCYVLGQEATILQLCLSASPSLPSPSVSPSVAVSVPVSASAPESKCVTAEFDSYRNYYSLNGYQIGWERSLDLEAMKIDRTSPEELLSQLRGEILSILSEGKDFNKSVSVICPNIMFRGVQLAGMDVGPDSDIGNPSAALSIPRYVATDISEAGVKFVGLFSSPLETALLREQVLDRQGKIIKKKKSFAQAKHVENFTVPEWSMIIELSNHLQYFIREHCVL